MEPIQTTYRSARSVEVPSEVYAVDIAILNSYQGFSIEIARLSLLLIAGLAFFLRPDGDTLGKIGEATSSALGCFVFASLAVAFALAHRYYSTDGVAEHIASYRHEQTGNPKALKEAQKSNNNYYWCGWILIGAVSTFFIAAILFSFTIARIAL